MSRLIRLQEQGRNAHACQPFPAPPWIWDSEEGLGLVIFSQGLVESGICAPVCRCLETSVLPPASAWNSVLEQNPALVKAW